MQGSRIWAGYDGRLCRQGRRLGVAGQTMSFGLRVMNDQAAAAGPFAKAARLLESLAGCG